MRGTAGRSSRRRGGAQVRAGAAAIALAVGMVACHGGASRPPSAAPSVNVAITQVSTVRRGLRSACKKLRAVAGGEGNRTGQMAAAGRETAEAAAHWSALLEASGGSGPGPYTAHPQWTRAGEEIRAAIAEMAGRIDADDPEGAYRACGRACGRFVAMDETAGVRLASDALYRFRQTARPLGEVIARGDLASVRGALPALEAFRDSALSRPGAGSSTPAEQAALLREFREDVARFLAAVAAENGVRGAYERMMLTLERAFDSVL